MVSNIKDDIENINIIERILPDTVIDEIVDLVEEAYTDFLYNEYEEKPIPVNFKDDIVFALGKWLKMAGYSYDSAKALILRLVETYYFRLREGKDETGIVELDERKRQERERMLEILESAWKGKERDINLLELFRMVLREEERALWILYRLEELIGAPSPFKDIVFDILDKERGIVAIGNIREGFMARGRIKRVRTEEGDFIDYLTYKEIVASVCPAEVTVYDNPFGGPRKYKIKFVGKSLRKPLTLGPAHLDEIKDRLKLEGFVKAQRLIDDVLSSVINAFVEKGLADLKEEVDAPGFFFINGKLIANKLDNIGEPKIEELKEALLLLNELAENWFSHIKPKFATVIKWAIVSPFIYALKQKGKWIPWLYLYGSSFTGKTTLGIIALKIWNLPPALHMKGGSSVDTEYRLGQILSSTTFPFLINEPEPLLAKDSLKSIIKTAPESTIARSKYYKGRYVDIPAMAPVIFTSNKVLPHEDAILRRFIIITFTYSERIPLERAREFENKMGGAGLPRLNKLSAIGNFAGAWIFTIFEELVNRDWLEFAEDLLKQLYEFAGLDPPDWISLRYEQKYDPYEEIREAIISFLRRKINEAARRISEYDTFEARLKAVLESDLLPWAYLKKDVDLLASKVIFTVDLARELRSVIGDIGGLKSIAEIMGWDYGVEKVGGKARKVAYVTLGKLLMDLGVEREEEEVEEETPKAGKYLTVLRIIAGLMEKHPEGIPEDRIFEEARKKGIEDNFVRQVLERAKKTGEVIQVSKDRYILAN